MTRLHAARARAKPSASVPEAASELARSSGREQSARASSRAPSLGLRGGSTTSAIGLATACAGGGSVAGALNLKGTEGGGGGAHGGGAAADDTGGGGMVDEGRTGAAGGGAGGFCERANGRAAPPDGRRSIGSVSARGLDSGPSAAAIERISSELAGGPGTKGVPGREAGGEAPPRANGSAPATGLLPPSTVPVPTGSSMGAGGIVSDRCANGRA